MAHPTRFAVASGADPRELAASLNAAAAAGYGDVLQMCMGPRGEVWAVVQAEGGSTLPILHEEDELEPPSPPPAAGERTTQIVSASTGRQVEAPSQHQPGSFATGEEPASARERDPLTPPPKKEGPSTKVVSPAGASR